MAGRALCGRAPPCSSRLAWYKERLFGAGWDKALLSTATAFGTCALPLWQQGLYGSGSAIYPLDERQPLLVPTALVLAIVSCVALARLGRASATEDGVTERVSTQACPTQDLQAIMAHELGLSSREGDVFAGIVAGETVREASSRLGLSMGTVSTYRSRICKKAGVKGVPALLALAAHKQGGQGKEAPAVENSRLAGNRGLWTMPGRRSRSSHSASPPFRSAVSPGTPAIEHEKPIVTIGLLAGMLVGKACGIARTPA